MERVRPSSGGFRMKWRTQDVTPPAQEDEFWTVYVSHCWSSDSPSWRG